MPPHVGIGLITFNRRDMLRDTIERVRSHTIHPRTSLVVADDGSTDGTLEMLHQMGVPFVTGGNAGVAWNKNRALFLLAELAGCDLVILLEDDTRPTRHGWEAPWIEVGLRAGHVNLALDHFKEQFVYGSGTAADPIRSRAITAQCAAFARDTLRYGGYFDSRYKGYGHEHVEHSIRLARAGYGGSDEMVEGSMRLLFTLIYGELEVHAVGSFANEGEADRNLKLTQTLVGDENYRAPWRDDAELRRFRGEMTAAQARHPVGFALQAVPNAVPPRPAGLLPWFGVRLPR